MGEVSTGTTQMLGLPCLSSFLGALSQVCQKATQLGQISKPRTRVRGLARSSWKLESLSGFPSLPGRAAWLRAAEEAPPQAGISGVGEPAPSSWFVHQAECPHQRKPIMTAAPRGPAQRTLCRTRQGLVAIGPSSAMGTPESPLE